MESFDTITNSSIRAALESLLLVATEPTPAAEFAAVLGVTAAEVTAELTSLAQEYEQSNRGFQLREVAGGWRYYTHPAYHEQVEEFVLSWDKRKLSQSALETLAVIAYYQPVSREGVRSVRGVNSDGVINSLIDKGLVREVKRDKAAGRAILYGTTTSFLEHFGLRSSDDLPPLEDFAPDEESRRFIRERLSGHSLSSSIEQNSDDLDEERELLNTSSAGYDLDEDWCVGEADEVGTDDV